MKPDLEKQDKLGSLELVNAIYEIGLLAHRSADLGEVIQPVVERILEVMVADFVGIALVDEIGGESFAGWGVIRGEDEFISGHRQGVDKGVVGQVLTTGEPMLLDDVRQCPKYVDLIPATRSELTVPLKFGEKIIGAIDVESNEIAKYDQGDLALLLAFANPVAQAIHTARLFQEERRRNRQLTAINRVGRITASGVDLDEMLRSAVETVRLTLGYAFVGMGLVDNESDQVVLKALGAEFPVEIKVGHRQVIGHGVVGETVRTGRSALIPDVTAENNVVTTHRGLRCEICCPIMAANEVIGFIDVEETQPDSLDAADLMLIETVADHIAQAVESSRRQGMVDQLREDLTGMVVHDRRNPLAVIDVTLGLVRKLELDL